MLDGQAAANAGPTAGPPSEDIFVWSDCATNLGTRIIKPEVFIYNAGSRWGSWLPYRLTTCN